jgi:hypothetical protein
MEAIATATDHEKRAQLRAGLVRYMAGNIGTFAFDDINCACRDTADASLKLLSKELWLMHDDLIDHPVSVTHEGWEALRRTVAFLATDLQIDTASVQSTWPFRDEGEWRSHQHFVEGVQIPDYDPAVHGRPSNPWWNRIPSTLGFAILGCIVVLVLVFLVIL